MRHVALFGASFVLVVACDDTTIHDTTRDRPALVAAPAASLPRQPGTNDDTWAGERWTNVSPRRAPSGA